MRFAVKIAFVLLSMLTVVMPAAAQKAVLSAQQLSPVVTEAERPFIAKVYRSPYFFHSKALQQVPYLTIELKTIYRQEDATFISLLNGVRDAGSSNCVRSQGPK